MSNFDGRISSTRIKYNLQIKSDIQLICSIENERERNDRECEN